MDGHIILDMVYMIGEKCKDFQGQMEIFFLFFIRNKECCINSSKDTKEG